MSYTIGNVIDLCELGISGRNMGQRPNPETLRTLIKAKWQEFIGEARSHDQKFELTSDGTRELELPSSVRMVTRVYVDNRRAAKTTPESRDNSYANDQAAA